MILSVSAYQMTKIKTQKLESHEAKRPAKANLIRKSLKPAWTLSIFLQIRSQNPLSVRKNSKSNKRKLLRSKSIKDNNYLISDRNGMLDA